MKGNINLEHPIDVVILWVDGNDSLHREKMNPYLSNEQQLNDKNFRTRFDQVEEIEYAIKSILKFAPFARKIFLVTDNQIPNFLKNKKGNGAFEKVEIVDHTVIFKGFEAFLPTFNCLPIETMLTNIPDLSEHFIYFNDDLFLIKETKPSDFFINKNPILRGKWSRFNTKIWYKLVYGKIIKLIGKKAKNETYGYKIGQQNIASKLGFKKYFKFDHTPAPLRKSTLENYFNENPEMRELNIKHKFRHPKQFTLQGLANHLEIQNKTCVLKNKYQLEYFGSYKKPLIWYKFHLFLSDRNKNRLFMCLQSLDLCPQQKLNFFFDWMNAKLNA